MLSLLEDNIFPPECHADLCECDGKIEGGANPVDPEVCLFIGFKSVRKSLLYWELRRFDFH